MSEHQLLSTPVPESDVLLGDYGIPVLNRIGEIFGSQSLPMRFETVCYNAADRALKVDDQPINVASWTWMTATPDDVELLFLVPNIPEGSKVSLVSLHGSRRVSALTAGLAVAVSALYTLTMWADNKYPSESGISERLCSYWEDLRQFAFSEVRRLDAANDGNEAQALFRFLD